MMISINQDAMSQGLLALGFSKAEQNSIYEKTLSNGREGLSPSIILKILLPDFLYIEWMWIRGEDRYGGRGMRLPWDGSLVQVAECLQLFKN
jgi:hypothetical protein